MNRAVIALMVAAIVAASSCETTGRGLQITKVDRIEIRTELDKTPAYQFLQRQDGEILFCYLDKNSGLILGREVGAFRVVDTLFDIQEIGINAKFYIHNLDTCFVEYNEHIYLVQRSDSIRQVSTSLAFTYKYVVQSRPQMPMQFYGGKLYVLTCRETMVRTREDRALFYEQIGDMAIDISGDTDHITVVDRSWPDMYVAGANYYDYYPSRCIDGTGRVVYSFQMTDSVWAFRDNIYQQSHEAKAATFAAPFEFPKGARTGNLGQVKDYLTTQSTYNEIIYDQYRDQFYRIAIHGIATHNAEGSKNTPFDRPCTVVVMDNQLQKIGEFAIDTKQYYPAVMPHPNGIMLQRRDTKIAGDLFFDMFEFSNTVAQNTDNHVTEHSDTSYLAKNTKAFCNFMQNEFKSELSTDLHCYVIIPQLVCKGCVAQTTRQLDKMITDANIGQFTFISNNLESVDPGLRSKVKFLAHSKGILDRIPMDIYNATMVVVQNKEVQLVRPFKLDDIPVAKVLAKFL